MQDSENQIPNGRAHLIDDDEHYKEHDANAFVEPPTLPRNSLLLALAVGVGGGILSIIFPLVLAVANASTYQEATRLGNNMPGSLAGLVLGLFCLSGFVPLVIDFFAGFIIGKIAVRRLFGFYAGIIVGVLYYLGSVFATFIPGYPIHSTPGNAIGVVLVLTIIAALAGGLVSLLGTYIASRKNPYYLARRD